MAFRRYRKFSRPRRFRRGVRRSNLRRKTVSKSVKRYVKKAIHRNIENKEIIDYWGNQTLQTLSSGTNTGSSCRNLLPLPAQGTDDHQRIGNQIRVVKGILKGYVNIKPYDAATNPAGTPCLVKLWLFRDLASAQTLNIQGITTYFDTFFRGNGTSLPFQGYPIDMCFDVNRDQFRVLATRSFKIGSTTPTSVGPVGTGSYYDNSPMTVPFSFNWGKYAKKMLKFNDTSAYPQNDNLYIVCQVVRADGTSSGGYQMAEWHAVNSIMYEDA